MYLADDKGNAINKLYPLSVDATMANGITAEFINDTEIHTPGNGYVYCKVVIVTNTVFAAIEPELKGNTFTGVSIPATIEPITQELTSIKLTSGSVLAYRRLK